MGGFGAPLLNPARLWIAHWGQLWGRYCCVLFGIGGRRLGIGSAGLAGSRTLGSTEPSAYCPIAATVQGAATVERRGGPATGRKTDSPVVDGGGVQGPNLRHLVRYETTRPGTSAHVKLEASIWIPYTGIPATGPE